MGTAEVQSLQVDSSTFQIGFRGVYTGSYSFMKHHLIEVLKHRGRNSSDLSQTVTLEI